MFKKIIFLLFCSCLNGCQSHKQNLTLPTELYFKGKIISPHCVDRYDSNIDSCMNDLETNKMPENNELIEPYETYYSLVEIEDDFLVTHMCFFSSKEDSFPRCSNYKMKYLGKLGEHMFVLYQFNKVDGNNYYYSAVLPLKRVGDNLVVGKKVSPNEVGYVTNAYIKGDTLYFEEELLDGELWSAIKSAATNSTLYNDWGKYNRIYTKALNEKDWKQGIASYHLSNVIMDIKDQYRVVPPEIPDKVEFINTDPFVADDEEIEIYENGHCSDTPLYSAYSKFIASKRFRLKNKQDFIDFATLVVKKCDEAIEKQSNNK